MKSSPTKASVAFLAFAATAIAADAPRLDLSGRGLGPAPTRYALIAADDPWPQGWAGTPRGDYQIGVDMAALRDGRPSAYIMSMVENPPGFSTIAQFIKAADYKGKRLRFRGFMKTQAASGNGAALWMRVNDAKGKAMRFDNMYERALKGTTDWTEMSIVLDVPDSADMIAIGALLHGGGRMWVNSLTFEIVEGSAPVAADSKRVELPPRPVNLDFTE